MGCFVASGRLAIIEEITNSALYHKILKENVGSLVCELKYTLVMQEDNDPKCCHCFMLDYV